MHLATCEAVRGGKVTVGCLFLRSESDSDCLSSSYIRVAARSNRGLLPCLDYAERQRYVIGMANCFRCAAMLMAPEDKPREVAHSYLYHNPLRDYGSHNIEIIIASLGNPENVALTCLSPTFSSNGKYQCCLHAVGNQAVVTQQT